ncbi:MAG: BrnT family toxin [Rhodospirillaceae bacterium]|nr:MAG: BrnT family toxin [Rhodospirillaceae bacterium]
MIFDYDIKKDASNRAKHEMPLECAVELFDGPVAIMLDSRKDYREVRYVAYGMISGRLCVCGFTDRGNIRRIISLRKANKRERDAYREN